MNIIEKKVVIESEYKIGATVAYLDDNQKKPLVLLIMGTGKLDRDGNGFGFKSNLYKDLSDMFVRFGFACIRYDKRGTHESMGNFKRAGLSDLVKDSSAVIEYVKTLPYIDEKRIIACGHSEGAMIATLLTKQQKLERIILLGGACMCLKSAMKYQNYKVIDECKNKKGLISWIINKTVSKEKLEKQINSLYEKAKNARKDTFFFGGAFIPSKWLREHGEFTDEDYISMIEEYNGKVLAITGKSDLQADYTCLDKISEFENVTTYAPDKVNHMLKEIDDDNSVLTIKKQYKRLIKSPIHDGTKQQIQEFLEL